MDKPIIAQTTALVVKDFEIGQQWNFLSETALLKALSEHVLYMMKYRMEVLMSTLYRLDVQEAKVAHALSTVAIEPPHVGIAKLIIERQKQRVHTKSTYKSPPLKDFFEF